MADWQLQTLADLNSAVLRLIECPACSDYMRPPITQCARGHSVCSRCSTKNDICASCKDGRLIRNYALEQLSERAVYPCEFRREGCDKKMLMSARLEHALVCPHRLYECKLDRRRGCSWKGRRDEVLSHARENHSDNVYEEAYIHFSFDSTLITNSIHGFSTLEKDCDSCFVVSAHGKSFYLLLRIDFGSRKLYVAVQHVGPDDEAAKYVYKVKFVKHKLP